MLILSHRPHTVRLRLFQQDVAIEVGLELAGLRMGKPGEAVLAGCLGEPSAQRGELLAIANEEQNRVGVIVATGA